MTDQNKIDLILQTLQGLADRVTRAEADAAAALDSAKAVSKSSKTKPTEADNSGLGFSEAMRLVHDAEDRTTNRLTQFLQLAMTSQKSAHDSFMRGLTLGRELAESDLDNDGEPDGPQYLNEIIDIVKAVMAKKGNGAADPSEFLSGVKHGLQPRALSKPGREADGDPGGDGA